MMTPYQLDETHERRIREAVYSLYSGYREDKRVVISPQMYQYELSYIRLSHKPYLRVRLLQNEHLCEIPYLTQMRPHDRWETTAEGVIQAVKAAVAHWTADCNALERLGFWRESTSAFFTFDGSGITEERQWRVESLLVSIHTCMYSETRLCRVVELRDLNSRFNNVGYGRVLPDMSQLDALVQLISGDGERWSSSRIRAHADEQSLRARLLLALPAKKIDALIKGEI